jgi:ATP-dependent Clp protease ATP-binding subunit ClpX
MTSRTFVLTICPHAKEASYRALATITRRAFSTTTRPRSQFLRSESFDQGYTSSYDPNEPIKGPLGDVSTSGVSRITPRKLKEYLDEFVVGQNYAKTVVSAAVYGHYLRIRELQTQEEREALLEEKRQRQAMKFRHPVEGR